MLEKVRERRFVLLLLLLLVLPALPVLPVPLDDPEEESERIRTGPDAIPRNPEQS